MLLQLVRHMKINNKSKVAMNIFHQAKRRIALIASLLGQFADVAWWKIGWQMDLLFFWLCLIHVLGYLDDIIIIPILIVISIRLIPKSVILECEEQAKEIWKNGKPKRWYYSIPIIFIWFIICSTFRHAGFTRFVDIWNQKRHSFE